MISHLGCDVKELRPSGLAVSKCLPVTEAFNSIAYTGNHQTVASLSMVYFSRTALRSPVLVATDSNCIPSYHTLLSRLQPACRETRLTTTTQHFIYTNS